jgi:hypothetical protein
LPKKTPNNGKNLLKNEILTHIAGFPTTNQKKAVDNPEFINN